VDGFYKKSIEKLNSVLDFDEVEQPDLANISSTGVEIHDNALVFHLLVVEIMDRNQEFIDSKHHVSVIRTNIKPVNRLVVDGNDWSLSNGGNSFPESN
jgi:hypothetical protein